MNILITGGTGYIGSHTAIVLQELGFDVVLYDSLVASSRKTLVNLQDIASHSFPFVQGDVRDTDLVQKTLRNYNIEAVIHFAGLKTANESAKIPIEYYANNVQGAVSLIRAMQSQNVKQLIFSSSATVYGDPKYLPCDENHPIQPINPYGRSKRYIEEILSDAVASDSSWRVACLRYFNPVGAHRSGLIGEGHDDNPSNLMPYIGQVAAGVRPELSIFGNDYETKDGTGVRDYIHVMDLAEGHVAALNFLRKFNGWHAFNLGTGTGYTVLEMIRAYENASGCRVPYRVRDRRAGDVAESYADISNARQRLNWSSVRNLSEMCASAWKHHQIVSRNYSV